MLFPWRASLPRPSFSWKSLFSIIKSCIFLLISQIWKFELRLHPPIQWHIAIACSPRFAHRKCRFYFEFGPAFVLKTMDSKWNPGSQEGASQVPSLQAIVDTCVVRGLLQQAWCLRKRQFSSRQMQGTWGICCKNAKKTLLNSRFSLSF